MKHTQFLATAPETIDQNSTRRLFVINANYELFILGLTILTVVNSFLWWLMEDPYIIQVVVIISLSVSLVLCVDFVFRLFRNRDFKGMFFTRNGWLLFLGSLPVPFIGLFRLIWYALMIPRFERSDYANMGQFVVQKRAQSTLLAAVFIAIVVLEISGITILRAELPSPQANIHDANDALWWAFVTMATVGYGDKYPVTTPGRIIGLFVMSVGVGLFSVLTSYLAQWFFKPRQENQPDQANNPNTAAEVDRLHARLDHLEELLNQQHAAHQEHLAEINTSLSRIEDHFRDEPGTN